MQVCVNSFFNGTSPLQLQAICRTGEIQAYNDAPYVYFGVQLWWMDGSVVWLKNGPIKSFYMDPAMWGQNDVPIFNTVTFR